MTSAPELLLRPYATALLTFVSTNSDASDGATSQAGSLLVHMCTTAPPESTAGALLDTVVLKPVVGALWASVRHDSTASGATLLGRLLLTRRPAVSVHHTDGIAEASSRHLVEQLLGKQTALQHGKDVTAQPEANAQWELLRALVAGNAVALQDVEEALLALCDAQEQPLEQLRAAHRDSGAALSAALWDAGCQAAESPAISTAAELLCTLLRDAPSARERRAEAGARGANSAGEQGVCFERFAALAFWRAAVHACPACAKVLGLLAQCGHVSLVGNAAIQLPRVLSGLLVTYKQQRVLDADAAQGRAVDGGRIDDAAVSLLVPVCARVCQLILSGAAALGDAAREALWPLATSLFELALPAFCSPAGVEDAQGSAQSVLEVDAVDGAGATWSVHASAAQAWREQLSGAAISDAVCDADSRALWRAAGAAASSSSLGARLVGCVQQHYQQTRDAGPSHSAGTPGAASDSDVRTAQAVSGPAAALEQLLGTAGAADAERGVADVWASLLQELSGIAELSAAWQSAAVRAGSDGATSSDPGAGALIAMAAAAQRCRGSECAGQLQPGAALVLALLLRLEDGKRCADLESLSGALAVTACLQGTGTCPVGAALATCVLHQADVLQQTSAPQDSAAEDARNMAASNWTLVPAVLAAVACCDDIGAADSALSSLHYMLAHLPDQVPGRGTALAHWVKEYALPDATQHERDRSRSLRVLSVLSSHLGSGSSAPLAGRDAVLAWLKWLSKREPMLARHESAPSVQHGMRVVACLCGFRSVGPDVSEDTAKSTAKAHAQALNRALALLQALVPAQQGGVRHSSAAPGMRVENGERGSADQTASAAMKRLQLDDADDGALTAALAAAAQHQLRSTAVQAQMAALDLTNADALLLFLHTCAQAASAQVQPAVWERMLVATHAYVIALTTDAEQRAEQASAAAVALAGSIHGSPDGMDASFALTFLSRLSARPGVLAAGAKADFADRVSSAVPPEASAGALLLMQHLRAAAHDPQLQFEGGARLEELQRALLRLVFCAGVGLHAVWVAGATAASSTRVVQPTSQFWQSAARALPHASGALPQAVREFDLWADDLGVPVLDAVVALLTCVAAPLPLRAAALGQVVQRPLLSRIATLDDIDGCDAAMSRVKHLEDRFVSDLLAQCHSVLKSVKLDIVMPAASRPVLVHAGLKTCSNARSAPPAAGRRLWRWRVFALRSQVHLRHQLHQAALRHSSLSSSRGRFCSRTCWLTPPSQRCAFIAGGNQCLLIQRFVRPYVDKSRA